MLQTLIKFQSAPQKNNSQKKIVAASSSQSRSESINSRNNTPKRHRSESSQEDTPSRKKHQNLITLVNDFPALENEVDAGDTEIDDEFKEVKSKKKRRNRGVQGSKTDTGTLLGAPYVFVVSGVQATQGISDLVSYVNEENELIDLAESDCEILKAWVDPDRGPRPPPKTLTVKVTVKRIFKEEVSDAKFWPVGMYVAEYRHQRRRPTVSPGTFHKSPTKTDNTAVATA